MEYKDLEEKKYTVDFLYNPNLKSQLKQTIKSISHPNDPEEFEKLLQILLNNTDLDSRINTLAKLEVLFLYMDYNIDEMIMKYETIPIVFSGLSSPSTSACELCLRTIINLQNHTNIISDAISENVFILSHLSNSPAFLIYIISIFQSMSLKSTQFALNIATNNDIHYVHKVCNYIFSFNIRDASILCIILYFLCTIYEQINDPEILNDFCFNDLPLISAPAYIINSILTEFNRSNDELKTMINYNFQVAYIPAMRLLDILTKYWKIQDIEPITETTFQRMVSFITDYPDTNPKIIDQSIYFEALRYFNRRLRDYDLNGNPDMFYSSPECKSIIRSVIYELSLNTIAPLRLLFFLSNASSRPELAYLIYTHDSFSMVVDNSHNFSSSEKECFYMIIFNMIYFSPIDILQKAFAPSLLMDVIEDLPSSSSYQVQNWILDQLIFLAQNYTSFFQESGIDIEYCVDSLHDYLEIGDSSEELKSKALQLAQLLQEIM